MTDDASGAARRLMARLDEFADFTDEPGRLTRLYLSPVLSRRLRALCANGRDAAGLEPEIDAAGNVRAPLRGQDARARRR